MGLDAASHFVTYESVGEIAHIGLNRPEKRNAISDRFVEALAEAVGRAEREAKAVVLHGHGNHFCAGLDQRSDHPPPDKARAPRDKYFVPVAPWHCRHHLSHTSPARTSF